VRKIRSYEESFGTDEFGAEAQDIYIQAHTHMAAKEKYKIREFVTERCYPEMMHNVKDKTIRWKFLQSLERARWNGRAAHGHYQVAHLERVQNRR